MNSNGFAVGARHLVQTGILWLLMASLPASVAQTSARPDANVAALWLFDESNYIYTPLLDATQNGYDLRLYTWGQLSPGKFGNCLHMVPGTNYHAYYSEWDGIVTFGPMARPVGEPSGLWGPTITPGRLLATVAGLEWTCEFWLKLASVPGSEAALLHLGYAYDPGLTIDLCAGGTYFRLTNSYAGWSAVCPMQNGNLESGAWHHLAFTVAATGNRVSLFVDGQLQTGNTWSPIPAVPVPPTIYPASLAANPSVFDNSLNYELFRQHRFNMSLGEDRHGQNDLNGYLDELRFSSVRRYTGNFTPPVSFSRNYGPNPPSPSVVTGPPLLFGSNAPVGPVMLGTRRHLFIDGALLETTNNVRWAVNPPRVDGMSQFTGGDNSAIDYGGDVWMLTPDSYESAQGLTTLWRSSDGTNFVAPDLGVVEWQGSTSNNYVLSRTPMWCRAFRDTNPKAPLEERFKMSAWVANSGIILYTSPDLVHWFRNETLMLPLVSGGGSEMYFDDQNGRYQFLMKRDPNMNAVGCTTAAGRLSVGFTSQEVGKPWPFQPLPSPGFIGWATPVVTCEGPIVFGVNSYGQVYRSRAIKYEWAPDVYLAFLWRFDSVQVRQTELAISRDGVNWTGLAPLGMYLPSGLVINGVSYLEGVSQQGLIRRGDSLWQYAGFSSGPHGAGQQVGGRLTQRLDGFVSIDTSNTGTIITRPLVFGGSMLTLNLDSHAGVTRVAILDAAGAPISGYDLADCDPITADSVNHIVTWGGNASVSSLAGTAVRLELEMAQTKLYALQFGKPGLVVVDCVENWNGLENPHAGDGVTLTGTGTAADPYVYTLPAGMRITAKGVVRMSADVSLSALDQDASVRFVFSKGDLQMEEGALIDLARPARSGQQTFCLDMGNGSITGSGRVMGLRGPGPTRAQKPRSISITNVQDVALLDIDLHSESVTDANPDINITARGRVRISGKIDTSCINVSDGAAGAIALYAEQVEVGEIDTRCLGSNSQAANGALDLRALNAAAGYDSSSGSNSFSNRLVLGGSIRLAGLGTNIGGPVRLLGVVLQLDGGYDLSLPANASLMLGAGATNSGILPAALFVNLSAEDPSVDYSVNWDGVPPGGSGPIFAGSPLVRGPALAGEAFSSSIAYTAADPDPGVLTFSKGSGPAWLELAADGTLSGTPSVENIGTNTWRIGVTDGSRFAFAMLQIKVTSKPSFFSDRLLAPNATQGMPYSASLATFAHDADGDSLVFFKESGPVWLNVAPDGALSGIPSGFDTFTNLWVVSVTDGTSSNAATLVINVCGQPQFLNGTISKAGAWANNPYSVLGQTLAFDASDPCGDSLTFAKTSGPGWLDVAPGGTLSGRPLESDVGTNTWMVTASDGVFVTGATLQIVVRSTSAHIVVSALEQWDGVQNPRAADGVLLTGAGSDADPATYTIPGDIVIRSGGGITMSTPPPGGGADQPPDNSIRFEFIGGGLHIEDGGYINVARRSRTGARRASFSMGGGSIGGWGRIIGLWDSVSTPRIVTITNVQDVSFREIDLHVENVNNSGRHLNIRADGRVEIGSIDNSDLDLMGNSACDVNIAAEAITVGGINVAAARAAGGVTNGNIRLSALAAPFFDINAQTANAPRNRLIVTGLLSTASSAINQPGNIRLEGVVVQTMPGFQVQMPPGGTLTLNAGVYPNGVGATAADMFVDQSFSHLTPAYVVEWSGSLLPLLDIQHTGGSVLLQWDDVGFTLQESTNLSQPSSWMSLTNASPASVPLGSGAKFYRLKK